jgi:hypothetical protein
MTCALDKDRAVALDPGTAKPSWLRSKDHRKWGWAMAECMNPQGLCGQDGWCRRRNFCFEAVRARHDALLAIREEVDRRIQRLLETQDGGL